MRTDIGANGCKKVFMNLSNSCFESSFIIVQVSIENINIFPITHIDTMIYDDWLRLANNFILSAYVTDLIRDHSMSKINSYQEGDDPLFLWVAFSCPHDPYQIHYKMFHDMYADTPEPRRTYLGE